MNLSLTAVNSHLFGLITGWLEGEPRYFYLGTEESHCQRNDVSRECLEKLF